mmetsp:Transcript_26787/g.42925  ORF Transcript_26787/g.42925 Transcript_26787/m.42925 type:complete len:256 (+) Transcript_26787:1523-2290(+)
MASTDESATFISLRATSWSFKRVATWWYVSPALLQLRSISGEAISTSIDAKVPSFASIATCKGVNPAVLRSPILCGPIRSTSLFATSLSPIRDATCRDDSPKKSREFSVSRSAAPASIRATPSCFAAIATSSALLPRSSCAPINSTPIRSRMKRTKFVQPEVAAACRQVLLLPPFLPPFPATKLFSKLFEEVRRRPKPSKITNLPRASRKWMQPSLSFGKKKAASVLSRPTAEVLVGSTRNDPTSRSASGVETEA